MFLPFARRAAICLCWGLLLGVPAIVFGQTNYYSAYGMEYAVVGSLPGDQVFPDAAVTGSGGFMVWQDNATDGSGWGISARRLDSTLSGTLGTFRVNQQGTNDQENARVALLKNGGAVFVWQGGVEGYQHVFARFLNASNTFLNTTDLVVSAFAGTNSFQVNPAVAVLHNSNVVVVWASYDQAGSNTLEDVYGKILSPTGQTISNEFLINQFTACNQRTPAIAALKNGGFVVTWISEQQRVATSTNASFSSTGMVLPSVDVYARLYSGAGTAQGGEFLVNTDSNPCANPAVAAAADGSFMITWDAHDLANVNNSLDIFARPFSSAGAGGTILRVNSHLYGDQYVPRISAVAGDYLIVWTSLGQDGSREGVFGQFVHEDGTQVGGEFQVNTATIGQQLQPVVTSDNDSQFLVAWTSYTGAPYNFDLRAQRYLNVAAILSPMAAPFVYAPFTIISNQYQPQLQISWPPLLGISVSNYQVYVDEASTAMAVTTSNIWTMTAVNGLTTNSIHSFRVNYLTTGGRSPTNSPSASGKTWNGGNYFGIPYEWMAEYFGGYNPVTGKYTTNYWPSANQLLGPGLTVSQAFLSGSDPFDSSTWLQTTLVPTGQGLFLSWNPQPGLTYQVQVSTNLSSWSNLGAARFAAGTTDSIYVGGGAAGYYRVLLLRQ